MRFHISFALAALSVLPLTVLAGPYGQAGMPDNNVTPPLHPKMARSPVPKFHKADKNGDGKIEWKEAKALGVPKKIFRNDDFDASHKLDKTQWRIVRLDMKDRQMHPPRTRD